MTNKWTPYKLAFIVIVLWATSFVVIRYSIGNWSERGQVGDLFGSIKELESHQNIKIKYQPCPAPCLIAFVVCSAILRTAFVSNFFILFLFQIPVQVL